MTLHSNGCLIHVAAATRSTLIVTSKRSLGPLDSGEPSHAGMGERWLHKHLERVKKNKEDLARVLYDNKWTAVAEASLIPFTAFMIDGLHSHT